MQFMLLDSFFSALPYPLKKEEKNPSTQRIAREEKHVTIKGSPGSRFVFGFQKNKKRREIVA